METDVYRVRWRYTDAFSKKTTACAIHSLNPQVPIGIGFAECTVTDQFKKDKGRKLSLLRAMKNAGISKEERYLLWEKYRNMSKKPRW
jgi:hypothetical protein